MKDEIQRETRSCGVSNPFQLKPIPNLEHNAGGSRTFRIITETRHLGVVLQFSHTWSLSPTGASRRRRGRTDAVYYGSRRRR
eukprot:1180701-Prorocentrum_minimum.AAC.1